MARASRSNRPPNCALQILIATHRFRRGSRAGRTPPMPPADDATILGSELGSGGEAHFFTSVCQFSTIVIVEGRVAALSVGAASIRNFWPSRDTS